MMNNSSGAALALLMSAADMVDYNENSQSVGTKCPVNFGYCPTWECEFQCVEGYTHDEPAEQPIEIFEIPEETSIGCKDNPCLSDDDCPEPTFCYKATGCCIYVE